jgi:hypothetical protein
MDNTFIVALIMSICLFGPFSVFGLILLLFPTKGIATTVKIGEKLFPGFAKLYYQRYYSEKRVLLYRVVGVMFLIMGFLPACVVLYAVMIGAEPV